MKVLYVEDYRVNQIIITPFLWSEMTPTRLGWDTERHPTIISGTWWKSFPCWKNSIWRHTVILIHTSVVLPFWYLVTARPRGSSSWFQLSETVLWNKPLVMRLMDFTHVRSAFFSHSQVGKPQSPYWKCYSVKGNVLHLLSSRKNINSSERQTCRISSQHQVEQQWKKKNMKYIISLTVKYQAIKL